MPGEHYAVREHDTLVCGQAPPPPKANVTGLPPEVFGAVQAVLLSDPKELNPVATPTRLGGQPAIKLTQWVGVLRTPSGAVVEVLPKTHERPGSRVGDDSLRRSRSLLLRMLAATDERFRVAPPTDLQTADMPLYEVVIRYALEGIRAAVRRGLPHAYVPVHEERQGLRGRLDLPRQVRQPPHRAHLLHVVYDEFLPDRPETRLTRLAVERLAALTRVPASQRLARELRYALDEVPPSRNVSTDFAAWRLGRGHTHFAPLEGICRMVLHELNPVVAGPQTRANALLFDMNAVYEAYVAQLLARLYPEWTVATQVTKHALGKVNGAPAFGLRPDLLISRPGHPWIVADTKWKRLNPEKAPTYDVSSADVYQMLAYSHVIQGYGGDAERDVWLIYPRLPGLPPVGPPVDLGGGRRLKVVTVDLEEITPEAQWPGEAL